MNLTRLSLIGTTFQILALSLIMKVKPAVATTVTYDFSVSGSRFLSGQMFSGSFSYDNSFLKPGVDGLGRERLFGTIENFEFKFLDSDLTTSRTYTEADLYPNMWWPNQSVWHNSDGSFLGIIADYSELLPLTEPNQWYWVILPDFTLETNFYYSSQPLRIYDDMVLSYKLREPSSPNETVPEPGTITGLCLLGLGFLLKKNLTHKKGF